jgi:NAD dependent epimerase/dehydratase
VNWSGRKVLVTGADGFIGSHLAERLVSLGGDVRAFCFYNSNGSLGWLDGAEPAVKKSLDVRLGDIRDARFVEEACRGVDTIFHLAALIAIPYSYTAPESFVDTNVKGTLNVLEGARRAGCRRMVNTSTSEVYGTPDSVPIRETHPLQGQSPYSASKIAADKFCEAYYCSFKVPVVTLRPFNTYGPRQSTRAVLPTILVQLLAGEKEVKLGRLDPKRDLTFVADTVEGFVKAAEVEDIEGEVIQLGTGRIVSIGELFDAACVVLAAKAHAVQDQERLRPDNSEVMVLLSDPSKAKHLLGWEARVPLEQGLLRTTRWLEKHINLYDPERYHR